MKTIDYPPSPETRHESPEPVNEIAPGSEMTEESLKETDAEREAQSALLTEAIRKHRQADPLEPLETGIDRAAFTPPARPERTTKPWFKRAAVALTAFFALGGAAKASANGTEGGKDGKKSVAKSPEQKKPTGGLAFYKGGVEKTPTGKQNAFSENADHLSEKQIYEMAARAGLPTENNEEFQQALLEKYPGVVHEVMEEYGQTNAGTFLDGILGARVKRVMERIEKTEREHAGASGTLRYRVSVSDARGGEAVFVLPKDAETFKSLKDFLEGKSAIEFDRSGMSTAELLELWADTPEKRALIKEKYRVDPNNPKVLIPAEAAPDRAPVAKSS